MLLATGQLEVELSLPEQVLMPETQPSDANFGMGLAAVDAVPQCSTEEAEGIQALVASKLELIESAAARVAPGTEVH